MPNKPQHTLITGHSGSGKSTLAEKLHKESGTEVINLDKHPAINAILQEQKAYAAKHGKLPLGKASRAKLHTAMRTAVNDSLSHKTPRIIEGSYLLGVDPSQLKGHKLYLVDPPEDVVLNRRVERQRVKDLSRSKIWSKERASGVSSRGQQLIKMYRPGVTNWRNSANVISVQGHTRMINGKPVHVKGYTRKGSMTDKTKKASTKVDAAKGVTSNTPAMNAAKEWMGKAQKIPKGPLIVGGLGVGAIGAGLYQRRKLNEKLRKRGLLGDKKKEKTAGLPRYLRNAVKAGKKFPKGSLQAKAIAKHRAGSSSSGKNWFKKNKKDSRDTLKAFYDSGENGGKYNDSLLDKVQSLGAEARNTRTGLGGSGVDSPSGRRINYKGKRSPKSLTVDTKKELSRKKGREQQIDRKLWHARSKLPGGDKPRNQWSYKPPAKAAKKSRADQAAYQKANKAKQNAREEAQAKSWDFAEDRAKYRKRTDRKRMVRNALGATAVLGGAGAIAHGVKRDREKTAGIPRALKNAIKSGKKFPRGSAQAKAIDKHLAGKQKHTQDWFKQNKADLSEAIRNNKGSLDGANKVQADRRSMQQLLGGSGEYGGSGRDGARQTFKMNKTQKVRRRKRDSQLDGQLRDAHRANYRAHIDIGASTEGLGYKPGKKARAWKADRVRKNTRKAALQDTAAVVGGTALGLGGAALTGRHISKKRKKKTAEKRTRDHALNATRGANSGSILGGIVGGASMPMGKHKTFGRAALSAAKHVGAGTLVGGGIGTALGLARGKHTKDSKSGDIVYTRGGLRNRHNYYRENEVPRLKSITIDKGGKSYTLKRKKKKTAGAVDSAAKAYRVRMDIAKKSGKALSKFRPSGSAADTGAAMQMMQHGRAAKASAAATLRRASTPTRTVPNRPVVHGTPRWPGDPRHQAKLDRAAAQTKKNPTREVPIRKEVSGRQGKIDFLRKKLEFRKKAGAQRDPRLTRAGVSGYNKPRRTPGHSTKSHIVVARAGGQVKTIRFGQQGVRTNQTAGQRKAFKSRHARNISRGPLSAAYWADKVKWSPSKTKDKANQKWVKGS